MKSVNVHKLADVLEKAAAYIDELETNLAIKEAKIRDMEAELEKSASEKDSDLVSALKEKGFSDEDIASMRSLPKQTIEKVASVEGKAWDLGQAHSKQASAQMDPIMAFILS